MFTQSTVIVCLLGTFALALTAISTGHRRKQRRIGPRAFQARLAMPATLSLGGFVVLVVTEIPPLQDASNTLGVLLFFVMGISSFTIPFALTFWVMLLALAKWVNVFAAIAVVSMGVTVGHVVGYVLGGQGFAREVKIRKQFLSSRLHDGAE